MPAVPPSRVLRFGCGCAASVESKRSCLNSLTKLGGLITAIALAAFVAVSAPPPQQPAESIIDTPALAARLTSGHLGFDQLLVVRRRELNPSHVYTYHVEGFGAGGGLYLASLRNSGSLKELVASPEGQVLDCDLSYDGREILFSWRRKQSEGYQVFVINSDGTNLRQLTAGAHHNYNAC